MRTIPQLRRDLEALVTGMCGTMSTKEPSTGTPSTSFQRAVDKFTKNLTVKQREEFTECSLEDVHKAIVTIQEKRGSQKNMRSMARIQAFLEAIEQYRIAVEQLLNCIPFMGYVWVWSSYKYLPF
jgi:predicted ribosome quality control (RQC) complex YloA/Tae2 family protein